MRRIVGFGVGFGLGRGEFGGKKERIFASVMFDKILFPFQSTGKFFLPHLDLLSAVLCAMG